MIHSEDQTIDLEEDEHVKTTVVGLRYTGRNSTESPRRPRDSGGWPGRSSFQGGPIAERNDDGVVTERDPGPMQIGIVPDVVDDETVDGGSLSGLENLADFEVVYDPAELAEALLSENYLPPDVFGADRHTPDYDARERVFNALGLDDSLGTVPQNEEGIREALADVADMDLDEDEVAPDASRIREYTDDYTRSELYNAAQALGIDAEWSESTKNGLAEQLAERPPGDVRDALAGEYDTDE